MSRHSEWLLSSCSSWEPVHIQFGTETPFLKSTGHPVSRAVTCHREIRQERRQDNYLPPTKNSPSCPICAMCGADVAPKFRPSQHPVPTGSPARVRVHKAPHAPLPEVITKLRPHLPVAGEGEEHPWLLLSEQALCPVGCNGQGPCLLSHQESKATRKGIQNPHGFGGRMVLLCYF